MSCHKKIAEIAYVSLYSFCNEILIAQYNNIFESSSCIYIYMEKLLFFYLKLFLVNFKVLLRKLIFYTFFKNLR